MRKGFTLIELLVIVAIIGLIAAVLLPNLLHVKDKAKEAEVKQNLHSIQLACESYAVDKEGDYPAYLVGGSGIYLSAAAPCTPALIPSLKALPASAFADPILRGGYFDEYPRNPFTKDGTAVQQLQNNIDGFHKDPARSLAAEPTYGTRFGPYGRMMGNVLADSRYPRWNSKTQQAGLTGDLPTYADVEYRFWDLWANKKPAPYLPGEFFYKSAGPIDSSGGSTQRFVEASTKHPILPETIDEYMLGAYGGAYSKGKDIIGDETPIKWNTKTKGIWPWTRSVSGKGLQGSPYISAGVHDMGSWTDQVLFGNPNGVPDGLILVVTSGETYPDSSLPSRLDAP